MNAGEKFSLAPREKKTSGSMPEHSTLCNKAFSWENNCFPWVLSIFLLKGLTDLQGESLSSQLQALPGVCDTQLQHHLLCPWEKRDAQLSSRPVRGRHGA